MAGVKSKSLLMSKHGEKWRKAFDAHKADETDYGTGFTLPPNIENGIAQLRDIKIGTYENGEFKGKDYFMAQATVLWPKRAMDYDLDMNPTVEVKVEGKTTRIMEPLCDTPDWSIETYDGHVQVVLNHLRKLGVDTESMEADEIDQTIEDLKGAQPFITFRTWRSKRTKERKNPRTNEVWTGLAPEDFDPESLGDTADENTDDDSPAAAPAPRRTAPASKPSNSAPATSRNSAAPAGKKVGATKAHEEESAQDFDETSGDLDALAERADNKDKDARAILKEMALKVISEKEYDDADNFKEVVKLMQSAGQKNGKAAKKNKDADDDEPAAGDATEGGDDQPGIEIGDVFRYAWPDKKGDPGKLIDCEVVKLSTKNETVSLRRNDTKKVIDNIPWSDLQGDDEGNE